MRGKAAALVHVTPVITPDSRSIVPSLTLTGPCPPKDVSTQPESVLPSNKLVHAALDSDVADATCFGGAGAFDFPITTGGAGLAAERGWSPLRCAWQPSSK